jgi:putative transcriptional regulator
MSDQRADLSQSPQSLRGHFLLATPVIGSGFFNRSLTYLCHHDEQGAMGIVVNHCLDMGLSDMLTHLDIDISSACPDTSILAAGQWPPITVLSCIAANPTGREASR